MLILLPLYFLRSEHDVGDALLIASGEESLHSVASVVFGSDLLLQYLEVAGVSQSIAWQALQLPLRDDAQRLIEQIGLGDLVAPYALHVRQGRSILAGLHVRIVLEGDVWSKARLLHCSHCIQVLLHGCLRAICIVYCQLFDNAPTHTIH